MRGFWPGIALMTLSTVSGAQISQSVRDLSTVTCREIMGADDRGRELSMAYMHGYINGKANRTTGALTRIAGDGPEQGPTGCPTCPATHQS